MEILDTVYSPERVSQVIHSLYSPARIEKYKGMIGKKVYKRKSGKPFKSGNKVNTVKTCDMIHPHTGVLCFTFEEDESYVACHQCHEVKENV